MTEKSINTMENIYSQSDLNSVDNLLYFSNEKLKKNFEFEDIIQKVASIFHENRRRSKLQKDGTYESVLEKSSDENWTNRHWTKIVDIANTKFEDLPTNWKYENLQAAKVVVELVYEKIMAGKEITPEVVEEISKVVHTKWLERNWKEWSFENQRVPYEQLSEEEKEKDRAQIRAVIQFIEKEK